MRRTFLLPLVVVFALSACKDNEIKNATTAELTAQLKAGEVKYAVDPSVSVALDAVAADSRCPENVDCIWAGNAEAHFILTDSQGEEKFILNTNPQFVTERIVRGYRIQLVKLTPYPNTNIVINQSDYKAELSIQKQ